MKRVLIHGPVLGHLPLSPVRWVVAAVVVGGCLASSGAAAVSPHLVYHAKDVDLELSADERALTERLERALAPTGKGGPTLDLRLVDAARRMAPGRVEARDALHAAGVSDAFAIPVRYQLLDEPDPLSPARKILETDLRQAGVTHYGVGMAGDAGAQGVALVFVKRRADVGQFPKRFTVRDRYLLTGTLGRGLDKPLVLMATPGGRVREVRTRFEHGVFWAMINLAEPVAGGGVGRYTVEVQAQGPHGTEVLNLLEVHAAAPGAPLAAPIVKVRPALRPIADVEAAEIRALVLINRSRKLAGLRELARSERLTQAARKHAKDMADNGFFGHRSPSQGDLGRRLRRAGFPRVLARENVAIAPHPDVAHRELLRSPSHLRNILDPDVRHVGIGAHQRMAARQPIYTFAQIFARLPRGR